jgi:hypothetical protein
VFEVALSKLDNFIRKSLATPADRIWIAEPSRRNREFGSLSGMVAFLQTASLSEADRHLLMNLEWLLARAQKLMETGDEKEPEVLIAETKKKLVEIFGRAVHGGPQ